MSSTPKKTTAVKSRTGSDAASIRQGFAEHLKYSQGVDSFSSTDFNRYIALAQTVRDRLMHQWLRTQRTHHDKGVKRVYYLSMEYLMGRLMGNNITNLKIEDEVRNALEDLGDDFDVLREQEVDAGLGNGGLGRLAACFLDSLASLNLPAFGYGLRYDYGIFRQGIENGYQVEHPDDWLRNGNPWEIERPEVSCRVNFGGRVIVQEENGRAVYRWVDTEQIIGVAFDTPIVGYDGTTVNTLRLWSSRADEEFNLQDFNEGDYGVAVSQKVAAENISKVLYPNDKMYLGKELRFKQQYFFVACSLWDIVRRFKKSGKSWSEFHTMAAIQLNDTHPAISVAELMRILVDDEHIPWSEAWDITVKTMGYTNHTLMPEALEKWSVPMFEKLLPRHLQIIYQINHDFLQQVSIKYPGDHERQRSMSIIEEGQPKQIRMAYMAIVGSHSVNGVAALHTELLKSRLVPQFSELFPKRFNNKTNGITQRRWLLKSNQPLAKLITETIGDKWITDLTQLKQLEAKKTDSAFLDAFDQTKRDAKQRLIESLDRLHDWKLNPDSIFDTQIKRIHEYKRQTLNALHLIMLYVRIKEGKEKVLAPRTFLFAGKAAPGYHMAKLIIKMINNISKVINNDPVMKDKLNVFFVPDYKVSMAERLIPATNVSEQISTAGTEASGTGNMKFMLNGALTVGTLDGANVEIVEEAGEENAYIFGLKTPEVEQLRPHYNPWTIYNENDEIKAAIDLLRSGHFNFGEPGIFDPIFHTLFDGGDQYMNLADLHSYSAAHQRIQEDYVDRKRWNEKAVMNIANAGKFSSDRTIAEYAKDIWGIKACKIPTGEKVNEVLDEAKRRT